LAVASAIVAFAWGDLTELNQAKGFPADHPDAPYQEKWFPGNHGSVGGGGDIRGLSDGALAWITRGAKEAGLVLDRDKGSRIHGFHPEPLAPLDNMSVRQRNLTYLFSADRMGPDRNWQVAMSAVRRWHAAAAPLPEGKQYRPATLSKVADALDAMTLPPGWSGDIMAEHVVVLGDELRALAKHYYGDPNLSGLIFGANRDVLDDPDDLFQGQRLRIAAAQMN
jgi:nucleoid-associated protein YgaU